MPKQGEKNKFNNVVSESTTNIMNFLRESRIISVGKFEDAATLKKIRLISSVKCHVVAQVSWQLPKWADRFNHEMFKKKYNRFIYALDFVDDLQLVGQCKMEMLLQETYCVIQILILINELLTMEQEILFKHKKLLAFLLD